MKFLEESNLRIDLSQSDIIIFGEVSEVIMVLVELKHKFPIGYIQGWTEQSD